jgi:hypothetical protein
MVMLTIGLLSGLPLVGGVLALILFPGATLVLIVAAKEAAQGKFPMPTLLIQSFRTGGRALLVLGGFYALGVLLLFIGTALIDGGAFLKILMVKMTDPEKQKLVQESQVELAILLVAILNVPLSLLFSQAAAVVHWNQSSPVKSLFFAVVALVRNFWAFAVYGLVWLAVLMAMGLVLSIVGVLTGSAEPNLVFVLPLVLLMATMMYISMYFPFRDSFDFEITSGELP